MGEGGSAGADGRPGALRAAARRRFDLIVIGGGIHGAGIARDAALRGLSVLLLEQHDFGFGTTWRSTKLIHGGLRYLEHGEFRLVFEGLRERAILLRTAPHLVRPLQFLVPVFRGGRYGPRTIRAGLLLYDLLSGGRHLPAHRALRTDEVAALEPALRREALVGGFTYFDAQAPFPERLCLENILDARAHGATVFNHVAVTELSLANGRVTGVRARDNETGVTYAFAGAAVVNATGPWADLVLRSTGRESRRLGGTKGSHIVVDFGHAGPSRAIYAEAGTDGRPFFIIPWNGLHLIGTTDIHFTGDPATVAPQTHEIEYLLQETARILPGAELRPERILYAFAGVRPLPRTQGRHEGAITRRSFIHRHTQEGLDGLFTIIGGKLTSYRALAEQIVNTVGRYLGWTLPPSPTVSRPLVPGTVPAGSDPLTRLLVARYGPRAAAVLALTHLHPELARPLCPHGPEIAAQAVYAIRHEEARTVGDVLLRRTGAGWNRCRGVDAAPAVAHLLAAERGWDRTRETAAVAAYCAEVDTALIPQEGTRPCP